MSEDRDTRGPGEDEPEARNGARGRLLMARTSCVIGLVLAMGGFVAAFDGGAASVPTGVMGAAMGILGYLLGSRQLGTITIIFSVAALFFSLAASQGLIPDT